MGSWEKTYKGVQRGGKIFPLRKGHKGLEKNFGVIFFPQTLFSGSNFLTVQSFTVGKRNPIILDRHIYKKSNFFFRVITNPRVRVRRVTRVTRGSEACFSIFRANIGNGGRFSQDKVLLM